ncbi:zinc finger, CCHC-type containing protein [Tanacetum coccineum]
MDQSARLRMFGSDTIKLDRMDVLNFTRWKEKMKFFEFAMEDTVKKNNKGNDKKRKGTWNSSKDNKKDKKPLSEKLHMASVTTTTDDWWYDSGATTHVCNNKDLFKTYKETGDGHEVMMGDNQTSKVIGSGNAFEPFKIYKAEVKNQRGKTVQILRGDRGDEYFSTEFYSYCESQSLIHQRITLYTPQQNGVAESKNRVLQDMINAMKGRKPNISYFRVRGCLAYYKLPLSNTSKLGSRGLKFVGYAKGDNENNVINKIPVLLNVEDAPKTYKVAITSRNSTFWKETDNDVVRGDDGLHKANLDDIRRTSGAWIGEGCWMYATIYLNAHTTEYVAGSSSQTFVRVLERTNREDVS